MEFLPISTKDMQDRNIEQFDFILVSGDAYVDHPSFGVAIISRLLEHCGYTVGIIPQPNWNDLESFNILKTPKYAFLVTAGNIDSMVNHYNVSKIKRKKDSYSPNGQFGLRPDRSTIVYCNKLRQKFGNIPIIIGGIEASLRRFSHYDYWSDKVRRSILLDSSADLLVYGMAENQIVQIAKHLQDGKKIDEITFVEGTSYKTKNIDSIKDYTILPSFEQTKASKEDYLESFMIQYNNTENLTAKILIEPYKDFFVVQNKPAQPLLTKQFDEIYELNYVGTYHNIYQNIGGVPAIEEVKFSIINNRGCFGNCNFCALAFHQGRVVQARSHESILKEAIKITNYEDFKGYIHDVGGPTANFRGPACKKQQKFGSCKDKQCLSPKPCKNLDTSHKDYLNLLNKIRKLPKIKKVFIRSGIRYDFLLLDKGYKEFLKNLCENHVSGQLKVAPEHVSKNVLKYMSKPSIDNFDIFKKEYDNMNKKLDKKQYLVPYFMSSHPGCSIEDAIELALYLKNNNLNPEQVQDFYPTPGTISTCMFYTQIDPFTKKRIFVEKSPHHKAIQRALMQYKMPQNYNLVKEGLILAAREDLIGHDEKCLIRPNTNYKKNKESSKNKKIIEHKSYKSYKKSKIRNIHKKIAK